MCFTKYFSFPDRFELFVIDFNNFGNNIILEASYVENPVLFESYQFVVLTFLYLVFKWFSDLSFKCFSDLVFKWFSDLVFIFGFQMVFRFEF